MSTAEVASSSKRTLGRERMARARQRSCFCPCERLEPPEEMGERRERKMFLFSGALVRVLVVDDSGTVIGVGVLEVMRWTRARASLSW